MICEKKSGGIPCWRIWSPILIDNHAVVQGGIYDGRLMADVLEEDIMVNQEAA